MTVLAADTWPTNADLIADVARLHKLDRAGLTIDLTYNTGKWWKKWEPSYLVTNDTDKDFPTYLSLDYRDLGLWQNHFGRYDLVAFDPPYQSQGGRKTSTVGAMNDAYGRNESAMSPRENQEWIDLGLTTAVHICKPRGVILVKVMDYISSGKLWLGVHHTLTHALTLPVEVEAIYTHVGKAGPQPQVNRDGSPRRQLHPRNNASTLLVLRKQATKKETAHV